MIRIENLDFCELKFEREICDSFITNFHCHLSPFWAFACKCFDDRSNNCWSSILFCFTKLNNKCSFSHCLKRRFRHRLSIFFVCLMILFWFLIVDFEHFCWFCSLFSKSNSKTTCFTQQANVAPMILVLHVLFVVYLSNQYHGCHNCYHQMINFKQNLQI